MKLQTRLGPLCVLSALLLACGPSSSAPSEPEAGGDILDVVEEDDSDEVVDPPVIDENADSDGDGLRDGVEITLGTDPFLFDTDQDLLGDGFEVDLATDPLRPTASATLAGRVLFSDGSPAANVGLQLSHADLSRPYAGTLDQSDSAGNFSFDHAWPVDRVGDAFLEADVVAFDRLHTASRPLPFLDPGPVSLDELVLETQPLARGMDFFVAVPHLVDDQISVLALTNPGERPAQVSWVVPDVDPNVEDAQGEITIAPGSGEAQSLPSRELTLNSSWFDGIETLPAGVRIRSDRPVGAALQVRRPDQDGMAAFACLPVTAQGNRHVLQTLDIGGEPHGIVTAARNSAATDLIFTETMLQFVDGDVVTLTAGQPHAFAVAFEDSVQFTGGDLTGTQIESESSIGVVSGNKHLAKTAMLEPVAAVPHWGTSFATFGFIGDQPSFVRIVGGSEGAIVTVNGEEQPFITPFGSASVPLVSNEPAIVTSDQPILVWQTVEWSFGGRAAIHIVPRERWSASELVWVFSAPGIETQIAVLVPATAADGVQVDGVSINSLPGFEAPIAVDQETVLLIADIEEGAHEVTAPQPVFPGVFGNGNEAAEFYAYGYTPIL